MRYSGFRVIAEALTGHKGWKPVWRDPDPQAAYDYIIIGGGGHGLATAYYLAKEFGQARIAVLEKGYLGGGNVGRNTTIIRSNYLLDGNEPFYEFTLKLWEGLEQDFNYNAMVSQRGIINLIHTDAQRDAFTRRGNAMILHGADARDAEPRAGPRDVSLAELRQRPLPDQGRACRSGAAARCGMTRWPGAMRAGPTCAAST